jgi:Ca2+-binding EF-hand superfamily protein
MELPPFVKEIKPPAGVVLAADSNSTTVYELEGDVYALNLVDLEREGLVEYRYLLKQVKASESVTPTETTTTSSQVEGAGSSGNSTYSKNQGSSSLSQQRGLSQSGSSRVTEIIRDIIKLFNMNDRNTISLTEAHNIISRSSQRMGRKLEDDEIREFFHTVEMDAEGMIDICEFQRVFERLFK